MSTPRATTHSPIPWEAAPMGIDWEATTPASRENFATIPRDICEIYSAGGNDGKIVCRCYGPDAERNAQAIVTAVNAHAELVAIVLDLANRDHFYLGPKLAAKVSAVLAKLPTP